jgi:hypothetical protein
MAGSDRMQLWVPLLFGAATALGSALPTPAAAQRVEVFVNGQRVADVVVSRPVGNGTNGSRYVKGRNGSRSAEGANGTRYADGADDTRSADGADAGNGADGLRSGFHSHSHIGPYDECFRDRVTGQGYCTGRHWGRHSGPHRDLYRETPSAALF